MNTINIGNRLEVFWDDFLIDTAKTTAFPRLMQPAKQEACFWFDQGSEVDCTISYPCIVKDDTGYKMYYIAWKNDFVNMQDLDLETLPRLCVLESTDGIHWTMPDLNITHHPEYAKNNVILDHLIEGPYVFYDHSPLCKKGEEYKRVTLAWKEENGKKVRDILWCWVSGDGYHFEKKYPITGKGAFDSMNTIQWHDGRYVCYMRGYENNVRDVRVAYSEDFIHWTTPTPITFYDDRVYQLYTNNIIPYERAPHVLIGFPTRYNERQEWTPNNDQIGSSAVKSSIMRTVEKRAGLASTDSIFMCSRDGLKWHRYNEAFLTPGYEGEHNWVYGDCYFAYNFVDSGEATYSLFAHERHRSPGLPKPLYRYEIRKDGFACMMADGAERVLITKPITFDGSIMHLNFETSAYGYIYVEVLDEEGNPLSPASEAHMSFEIYGNHIDRKIWFADGSDFAAYAGQPVRLRFTLCDAKIYAFFFE